MAPRRYVASRPAATIVRGAVHSHGHEHGHGEAHKFDPAFRGPVQRRSYTDVLCCLIFFITIICYLGLGIMAWLHGDPRKLLHPTDSYGHFCGQKGTPNANKPLLFHFNILRCANPALLVQLQCPTTQICVSTCPDRFSTYSEMQLQLRLGNNIWDYYRGFCRPGFNNPNKPVSQVLRDEDCPSMILPSRPFLQRCLPDLGSLNGSVPLGNKTGFLEALEVSHSMMELKDAARRITSLVNTKELGVKILEDYAKSWSWILIGLLVSVAVSLIFILLLRFTAGLLLWTTVISVILLLAYGVWFCSMQMSHLRHQPGSEVSILEVGLHADFQLYLQLRQTWILLLSILGLLEVSVLLMLIFLRRRFKMAVALLREASRAVGHVTCTLLYPLLSLLLLSVSASFWALTAIHLASLGEPVYRVMSPDASCRQGNSTCNPETFSSSNMSQTRSCLGSRCVFWSYDSQTWFHVHLPILQISNLLLLFWMSSFILALQQSSLAGAFACCYWARRKPRDLPPHPLLCAFCTALRYHTGSLAFGALVLSSVQTVRILLEYLESRLRGLDTSLSRFFFCCLRCCFWCLEKFLRYMNRNAYIMVAIYGKNFCTSAREAFFLLMRNVVRVAVLDRVTDFLLFLGKVLIAGGVGVLAYLFFTKKIPGMEMEVPELHCYWVPVLTLVGGAYLIAHGFFSVYALCVDTFFLCFCDDLERNDGSMEKPFFMSPELHRILGKSSPPH